MVEPQLSDEGSIPSPAHQPIDACGVSERVEPFVCAALTLSDLGKRKSQELLDSPRAGKFRDGTSVSRHFPMLSEMVLTDDNAHLVRCAYLAASRRSRSPSPCR